MGEVIAHLAMSPDGFIADPDDGCDEVFGFYQGGDVAVKLSEGFPEVHVPQATVDLLTASVAGTGATVVCRRLYDLTNGWGGHPGGEVPMVVVTHHPPQNWPRGGVPSFSRPRSRPRSRGRASWLAPAARCACPIPGWSRTAASLTCATPSAGSRSQHHGS